MATRDALDASFDHPNQYADTCVPPVELAPSDEQNNSYVAVLDQMFQWPVVQDAVGDLFQQGLVEEITEEQYREVLPTSFP